MTRTPEQLLRRVFPPMLATLVGEPPEDDRNWSFELKYDGFRAVAAIAGGKLAMWSRNELDLVPRFPHIAEALRKLKVPEVVLDGEIVAVDEKGVPRFQLLQGGAHRERIFLFDILWLDGQDLRRKPYTERRAILEKTIKRPPAGVAIAEKLEASGVESMRRAAEDGWEGVIAKRNSSVYEGRRSKEWLKIKALNQQELVVIGFQPSTASTRDIGSLHLAVVGDDGALRYAGKVGTGFSSKLRGELKKTLMQDVVDKPPAKDAPRVGVRDATWVKPRLVAQVAFTEWTSDHRLRHPSFLGLRDDKSPAEVVREKPMPTAKKKSSSGSSGSSVPRSSSKTRRRGTEEPRGTRGTSSREVTLSNPDRILYPRDGITKADLAAYYEAVSEPLLRALKDRPLALEHWNQGIDKPSWFHQNVGKEAPEWITTIDTPTRTVARKSVKHLVADRPETLRYLAQMSVLTVHMWHARGASLDKPDWIVFDLDPAKGKGIEQAIEAAIVMRRLLENLEIPGFPKTSGKRGIHILVPLAPRYTHEEAAEWAFNIASAVASKVPDITVERSLAKRRGRLYLDAMQNAYGKTVVAPYSPRAADGAPVSAPLKWEEITKKLDPLKYNIRTMPDRLAKVGDLFAAVFKEKVILPELQ